MSQRKNSLVLSQTAIDRLNGLVQLGTYATIEDAANHIITSALIQPNQTAVSPKTVLPATQTIPESNGEIPQDDSPLANFLAMDFDS